MLTALQLAHMGVAASSANQASSFATEPALMWKIMSTTAANVVCHAPLLRMPLQLAQMDVALSVAKTISQIVMASRATGAR
jgi:hypothetical protein